MENNTNIGLHYRHIKRNVILKIMKVIIRLLSTQEIDYKSLLIKAMNQLHEQQEEMKKKDEMMANMIDKIGNTTNNTTNNMNHFNINMFLNENVKMQ